MVDIQVRRLPVVDRDKRLVGIVSLGDIATDAGGMEAGRPSPASQCRVGSIAKPGEAAYIPRYRATMVRWMVKGRSGIFALIARVGTRAHASAGRLKLGQST